MDEHARALDVVVSDLRGRLVAHGLGRHAELARTPGDDDVVTPRVDADGPPVLGILGEVRAWTTRPTITPRTRCTCR